jgi:hypothetical protein
MGHSRSPTRTATGAFMANPTQVLIPARAHSPANLSAHCTQKNWRYPPTDTNSNNYFCYSAWKDVASPIFRTGGGFHRPISASLFGA